MSDLNTPNRFSEPEKDATEKAILRKQQKDLIEKIKTVEASQAPEPGTMTTKPPTKPPLSVWLMENPNYPGTGLFKGKQSPLWDQGPYVHLDQFMELVEARANEIQKLNPEWTHNTCEHVALHNTALEIKEGKKEGRKHSSSANDLLGTFGDVLFRK